MSCLASSRERVGDVSSRSFLNGWFGLDEPGGAGTSFSMPMALKADLCPTGWTRAGAPTSPHSTSHGPRESHFSRGSRRSKRSSHSHGTRVNDAEERRTNEMGMLEKGGGERAEESGGEDDELEALEAQERRMVRHYEEDAREPLGR